MNHILSLLLFVSLLPVVTGSNRQPPSPRSPFQPDHLLQERQQQTPGSLCPIPCDPAQKWCCLSGQKCIPNASGEQIPYQCDDVLLQTTMDAFAGDYLPSLVAEASSLVESIASEYSFPLTPTTTAPATTTQGAAGTGVVTLGPTKTGTGASSSTSTSGAVARWGGDGGRGIGSVFAGLAVCFGAIVVF